MENEVAELRERIALKDKEIKFLNIVIKELEADLEKANG